MRSTARAYSEANGEASSLAANVRNGWKADTGLQLTDQELADLPAHPALPGFFPPLLTHLDLLDQWKVSEFPIAGRVAQNQIVRGVRSFATLRASGRPAQGSKQIQVFYVGTLILGFTCTLPCARRTRTAYLCAE